MQKDDRRQRRIAARERLARRQAERIERQTQAAISAWGRLSAEEQRRQAWRDVVDLYGGDGED